MLSKSVSVALGRQGRLGAYTRRLNRAFAQWISLQSSRPSKEKKHRESLRVEVGADGIIFCADYDIIKAKKPDFLLFQRAWVIPHRR